MKTYGFQSFPKRYPCGKTAGNCKLKSSWTSQEILEEMKKLDDESGKILEGILKLI